MAWPKSEEPKTHVFSFKVSVRQLQILRRYAEIKELNEAEALRRMIDGAEAWVRAHSTAQTTVSSADTSHQLGPEHHIDDEEDGNSGPLGYIGGRLNVGLPGGGEFSTDGEDLPGDDG